MCVSVGWGAFAGVCLIDSECQEPFLVEILLSALTKKTLVGVLVGPAGDCG